MLKLSEQLFKFFIFIDPHYAEYPFLHFLKHLKTLYSYDKFQAVGCRYSAVSKTSLQFVYFLIIFPNRKYIVVQEVPEQVQTYHTIVGIGSSG